MILLSQSHLVPTNLHAFIHSFDEHKQQQQHTHTNTFSIKAFSLANANGNDIHLSTRIKRSKERLQSTHTYQSASQQLVHIDE